MENSMKLIMLGTGNAATVACYNTCFALCREDKYFLVDAGGGNGILSQLQKAHIPLSGIHEIFVTHAHTDHILGVIWMIRMVAQAIQKGEYRGELRIYGHDKVVQVLDWICRMTLPKKIVARLGEEILLCEVKSGEKFQAIGLEENALTLPLRRRNSLVSVPVFPTDNRWFVWVMNPIMHATRCMWKEPTGCCVRRSACMKTGNGSNPTRSIIARLWMPAG